MIRRTQKLKWFSVRFFFNHLAFLTLICLIILYQCIAGQSIGSCQINDMICDIGQFRCTYK